MGLNAEFKLTNNKIDPNIHPPHLTSTHPKSVKPFANLSVTWLTAFTLIAVYRFPKFYYRFVFIRPGFGTIVWLKWANLTHTHQHQHLFTHSFFLSFSLSALIVWWGISIVGCLKIVTFGYVRVVWTILASSYIVISYHCHSANFTRYKYNQQYNHLPSLLYTSNAIIVFVLQPNNAYMYTNEVDMIVDVLCICVCALALQLSKCNVVTCSFWMFAWVGTK